MRRAMAFLYAPLWVPLIVELYVLGMPGPGPPQMFWVVFIAVIAAFFAYVGMIVIGIPAYLFLRWKNWTALWPAAAVGFVAGIVMSNVFAIVFYAVWGGWKHGVDKLLDTSLYGHWVDLVFALVGMLVAATAWLIIRPDREAAEE